MGDVVHTQPGIHRVAYSSRLELFRYHEEQRRWINDFMAGRVRYPVVPAGRRSGKTAIAKRLLVREAFKTTRKNARYFFGAPTRMQAKNIYWRDLKEMCPAKLCREVSESELRVELMNGASIHVFGLEAAKRIEGLPWDGCVLDEYANVDKEVWPVSIRPALSERQGWAMFIGVPRGRNHYYKTWINAHSTEEWGAYTWHSADILPPAEIESQRRDLDPRTFRQEFEASFEEASGRVYYAFELSKHVKPVQRPHSHEWIVGVDFNVHPMSYTVGYIVGRTIYYYRSFQIPSSNTYEVCTKLKADGFFPATIYPDPTGRARKTNAPAGITDHSIFKREGFKVVSRTGPPPIRDRINAVNTKLWQEEIVVDPACTHLIEGFDGLLYKEDTSEPDKDSGFDHITDAATYLVEYLFPVRYGSSEAVNF